MSFNNDELSEFRGEALELLEIVEKSLLSIENGGEFKSNFDAMFRVFHNLKGASGMMGLEELGKLMHQLENLLNSTKESQTLTKEQIDFFFKGSDQAKVLLGAPSGASASETQVVEPLAEPIVPAPVAPAEAAVLGEAVIEFLTEAQEISQRISLVLQELEKSGANPALIDSLYREIHTLKGGSYLFDFKDLGDLNHAMESVLDNLRENPSLLSKSFVDAMFSGLDLIDVYLLKIKGQSSEDLSERISKSIGFFNLYINSQKPKVEAASEINQESTVKEEIMENNNDNKEAKEAKDESSVPTPIAAAPAASQANPTTVAAQAPSEADKESQSTIRVPVPLLDKLMTLMGEMVLVRNQVIQYSNRTDDLEFLNLSQRLNVVTGEIQGEMMKTRMQPIGNVLSKFSRLVRELSRDLNKKIEMHLSGSETELDKTLLEAVKDPLTHIVRNSCDHGIETPAERKAAGKPETGSISINSFHEGGQVIIEITDDGKGLHRDKLLKKAIEKGVVTQERAGTMSDSEIVHLIFAPGFSTAAKVTNVSGRGVGMDVVRTNIEKIGGSVEIQSEAGRGTTLRLKIPLTLAIVPAMVVKCENDFFAIPQLKLVELVRVESSSENKIEYIQGHPVYRLRGNILPLIHIRKILGLKEPEASAQEVANIVVLNSDQHSFGLIVDDIQDTADIVVKPLARFLKPIGVYSGATVLGDGSIALILDVAGIVKEHISNVANAGSARQALDVESNKKMLDDLQDFLLLRLGAPAKHAILLGYVHRLEEFKRSAVEISGHKRIVRYRNSVLPLISVNGALDLSDKEDIQSDVISVVVIEKSGSLYGLEVNEILDVLTSESVLDTTVTSPKGVIGNLVTDKEIVVVIDPYKLIQAVMGLDARTVKAQLNMSDAPSATAEAGKARARVVKKILYVEDAAFFRRHVSKALISSGFEVTMANNGKEACELLDKSSDHDFDLILSDIEMPQMNGFEFAKFVRASKRWSHMPMIALSTRSDQKHVEHGYEVGFNAYLEKMNAAELLEAIDDLCKKGSENRNSRGVA